MLMAAQQVQQQEVQQLLAHTLAHPTDERIQAWLLSAPAQHYVFLLDFLLSSSSSGTTAKTPGPELGLKQLAISVLKQCLRRSPPPAQVRANMRQSLLQAIMFHQHHHQHQHQPSFLLDSKLLPMLALLLVQLVKVEQLAHDASSLAQTEEDVLLDGLVTQLAQLSTQFSHSQQQHHHQQHHHHLEWQIYAALLVLAEWMAEFMSDEQFPRWAPTLFPTLFGLAHALTSPSTPPPSSSSLDPVLIKIQITILALLSNLVGVLHMVKEEYPDAPQTYLLNPHTLDQWMTMLNRLITSPHPIDSHNRRHPSTGTSSELMAAVLALVTRIMRAFGKHCAVEVWFAWTDWVVMGGMLTEGTQRYLNTHVFETDTEEPVHGGQQQGWVEFLVECLDLVKVSATNWVTQHEFWTASSTGHASGNTRAQVLIRTLIELTQMTMEQEEIWMTDTDQLIEDEEMGGISGSGLRFSAIEVLTALLEKHERLFLAVTLGELQHKIARAQSFAEQNGDPCSWWKSMESCLYILGRLNHVLLDAIQSKTVQFDLQGLFEHVIQHLLTLNALPFLKARALWFASKYARVLPPSLVQLYVKVALHALKQTSESVPVRVASLRAMRGFFDLDETPAGSQAGTGGVSDMLRAQAGEIFEAIVELASHVSGLVSAQQVPQPHHLGGGGGVDSDTLCLVLETLLSLVPSVTSAGHRSSSPALIQLLKFLYVHFTDAPLVSSLLIDLLSALSTSDTFMSDLITSGFIDSLVQDLIRYSSATIDFPTVPRGQEIAAEVAHLKRMAWSLEVFGALIGRLPIGSDAYGDATKNRILQGLLVCFRAGSVVEASSVVAEIQAVTKRLLLRTVLALQPDQSATKSTEQKIRSQNLPLDVAFWSIPIPVDSNSTGSGSSGMTTFWQFMLDNMERWMDPVRATEEAGMLSHLSVSAQMMLWIWEKSQWNMHAHGTSSSVEPQVWLPRFTTKMCERLARARLPTTVQTCIVIVARLLVLNLSVLDWLKQIQIGCDGNVMRSGMDIVIQAWSDSFDDFHGYADIKLATLGLAKLRALQDPQILHAIMVKGDRIISAQNAGRIMTRSRTQRQPDQWTSVPFGQKLDEILMKQIHSVEGEAQDQLLDLVNAGSGAAGVVGAGDEWADDEDDEDGDWEEMDPRDVSDDFGFLNDFGGFGGVDGLAGGSVLEVEDEWFQSIDPISQVDLGQFLASSSQ